MLKVEYMSDLHIGINKGIPSNIIPLNNVNNCDVLVLAGDITDGNRHTDLNHFEFILKACNNYPHVIYVLGNHDHYGYVMQFSVTEIQDKIKKINNGILPENIIITEKGVLDLPQFNTTFICATLWTDVSKRKHNECICDVNHIKYFDTTNMVCRMFSPNDITSIHKKHLTFIKQQYKKYNALNRNIIVVTHHSPTFDTVHDYFKEETFNVFYATNLNKMIKKYSNIKYWIYGHTHHNVNYKLHNTTLLCNPCGYLHNKSDNFRKNDEVQFNSSAYITLD